MKQKLRAGETVFGQMILELFTPGVAPVLHHAGLDFVIYDMEYGEWFGYLHRDGRVSSRAKGTIYKGPFHLPRMLWYCWQRLQQAQSPCAES